MNILTIASVSLLTIVVVWFMWPVVIDPIRKARGQREHQAGEMRRDDFFRTWVKNEGPGDPLLRVGKG